MRFLLLATTCWLIGAPSAAAQDERTQRLIEDRENFASDADWYYDDVERGFAEAKRTGKPLLVVLRCVPCEACKVFDEQVAHDDPRIKELLDQFICVRVVKTNGLDLSLFQADFDQSFGVFMLNADRTIYGRYGTRPETEAQESEMSLDGFAATLRRGLELHRGYPANRAQLVGKTPPKPKFATPEDNPELAKYREFADVKPFTAEMCIHCHQVRDAERLGYRQRNETIPAESLFTWPSPAGLGLRLDPATATTIAEVAADSPAVQAGIHAGDELRSVNGQAVISLADLKWALDRAGEARDVDVIVKRGDETKSLKLQLPAAWRAKTDISSRVTTWDLRRMATGGLVLESLAADARAKMKVPPDELALRVKYVGQYDEHAAGKQAGFQEGDVIVEYDGHREDWRETDLIAHGVMNRVRGDKISVVVVRDGQRLTFTLPMQ